MSTRAPCARFGVQGSHPLSSWAVASSTQRTMNENVSLIVMCLFLLGSLAFLAQQLTAYH